jgi:transcriptional regulator with XRE-family HTH domain
MTFEDMLTYYKTQRSIADALGVTESAVANWKSRGRIPSLQQFRLYYLSEGELKPSTKVFLKGPSND